MTVRELVDCLSNDVNIILEDRNNEKGTMYEGQLLRLRTFWHDEEVCWIRVRDFQDIAVEIESKEKPEEPERCLYSGKHKDYEYRCADCEYAALCFKDPELAPGNPEACAGNVERGGHCCDECDYFLKCFPECAEVDGVWEEIGKVFNSADIIPGKHPGE